MSKLKKEDINPLNDGVDHIRVHYAGTTSLGRSLSPEHPRAFFDPKHGTFLSTLSAWYYMSLEKPDENVKGITGGNLRQYVRTKVNEGENTMLTLRDKEHSERRKKAIDLAVKSILGRPRLVEALANNDLPLVTYFVNEDNKVVFYEDCFLKEAIDIVLNKTIQ